MTFVSGPYKYSPSHISDDFVIFSNVVVIASQYAIQSVTRLNESKTNQVPFYAK